MSYLAIVLVGVLFVFNFLGIAIVMLRNEIDTIGLEEIMAPKRQISKTEVSYKKDLIYFGYSALEAQDPPNVFIVLTSRSSL